MVFEVIGLEYNLLVISLSSFFYQGCADLIKSIRMSSSSFQYFLSLFKIDTISSIDVFVEFNNEAICPENVFVGRLLVIFKNFISLTSMVIICFFLHYQSFNFCFSVNVSFLHELLNS